MEFHGDKRKSLTSELAGLEANKRKSLTSELAGLEANCPSESQLKEH